MRQKLRERKEGIEKFMNIIGGFDHTLIEEICKTNKDVQNLNSTTTN